MIEERAKPLVWIFTPLRSFEYSGPMEISKLLDELAPHYSDPIRELSAWKDCPWDIHLMIVGGGGIFQARNRTVSDFMEVSKNDNDRFFCRDYDLLCSAQDIVDILSHDIAIVGGLYTTRADNGHWVMNRLEGARPSDKGILPVMELGTGFKCFKRSALAKVLADNPWINCESDHDHTKRTLSFFSMGPVWDKKLWPGRGRALTEDYWLDWLCRESGIPTVVDTKIKLRHYDEDRKKIFPAIFPPDPGRLEPETREP